MQGALPSRQVEQFTEAEMGAWGPLGCGVVFWQNWCICEERTDSECPSHMA